MSPSIQMSINIASLLLTCAFLGIAIWHAYQVLTNIRSDWDAASHFVGPWLFVWPRALTESGRRHLVRFWRQACLATVCAITFFASAPQ
jgi:hypothetical protein